MPTLVRNRQEEFMLKHIKLFRKKRVLDVGSGQPARYRHWFRRSLYFPFDKRTGTDVCEGIPMQGDCAYCTNVLEHVIDPAAVLRNIRKAIGTGYLLITVPMVHELHFVPNDYYRFTDEFPHLLGIFGFEVLDKEIALDEEVGTKMMFVLCKGKE